MEQVLFRIKNILEAEFASEIQKVNAKMQASDITNYGKAITLHSPVQYKIGVHSVNNAFVPSVFVYNTNLRYNIQDWGTAGVINLPIMIDINIRSDNPTTLSILRDRYLVVLLNIFAHNPRLGLHNNDEIAESTEIIGSDIKVMAHSPENFAINCIMNVNILSYSVYKYYGLD